MKVIKTLLKTVIGAGKPVLILLNSLAVSAAYRKARGLKLHLGCGEKRMDGYINVDMRKTPAVDLLLDVSRLPFPDNSASRVETYHLIEHMPRNQALSALREWLRVLEPGGKLVIECPDFDSAAREYLAGNAQRLDSIYGLQRFPGDTHFFGYNFSRLKEALEAAGGRMVLLKAAEDYHTASEPCIRVECTK